MKGMRRLLAIAGVVAAATACRTAGEAPRIVQPGPPGQPSRTVTAREATDLSRVQATPADARFMQSMIPHHAQALEMTALVATRTGRADMRLLAERIDVSQADEISLMQRWLEDRGFSLPDAHAHHAPGMPMPGMLTPAEMDHLAKSHGAAFDALFLELMIKHHEGALMMVKELFSTPGAGQESEVYAFASDVVADQRMEIQRMDAMRRELGR